MLRQNEIISHTEVLMQVQTFSSAFYCGIVVCLLATGHVVGRQAIVVHEVIRPLSRLFDDEQDIVRRNAHRAIEMISESNIGLYMLCSVYLCKLFMVPVPVPSHITSTSPLPPKTQNMKIAYVHLKYCITALPDFNQSWLSFFSFILSQFVFVPL